MSTSQFSDIPFSDLELHPTLKQGVEDAGFDKCTPIQAKSLPLARAGNETVTMVTLPGVGHDLARRWLGHAAAPGPHEHLRAAVRIKGDGLW